MKYTVNSGMLMLEKVVSSLKLDYTANEPTSGIISLTYNMKSYCTENDWNIRKLPLHAKGL
jgi:hypothetical protein